MTNKKCVWVRRAPRRSRPQVPANQIDKFEGDVTKSEYLLIGVVFASGLVCGPFVFGRAALNVAPWPQPQPESKYERSFDYFSVDSKGRCFAATVEQDISTENFTAFKPETMRVMEWSAYWNRADPEQPFYSCYLMDARAKGFRLR